MAERDSKLERQVEQDLSKIRGAPALEPPAVSDLGALAGRPEGNASKLAAMAGEPTPSGSRIADRAGKVK